MMHPKAAVGSSPANGFGIGSTMKSNPTFAIGPEANPETSEGVFWIATPDDHVLRGRIHPTGIFDLVFYFKGARRGFPARFTYGNGISF